MLLITPQKGDEMLWQESADFWFAMAQGHAGTEPPTFAGDAIWRAIRNLDAGILNPSELGAFLTQHGVTEVIVDQSVANRWDGLLARTLRTQPVAVGGVEVFRGA